MVWCGCKIILCIERTGPGHFLYNIHSPFPLKTWEIIWIEGFSSYLEDTGNVLLWSSIYHCWGLYYNPIAGPLLSQAYRSRDFKLSREAEVLVLFSEPSRLQPSLPSFQCISSDDMVILLLLSHIINRTHLQMLQNCQQKSPKLLDVFTGERWCSVHRPLSLQVATCEWRISKVYLESYLLWHSDFSPVLRLYSRQ